MVNIDALSAFSAGGSLKIKLGSGSLKFLSSAICLREWQRWSHFVARPNCREAP